MSTCTNNSVGVCFEERERERKREREREREDCANNVGPVDVADFTSVLGGDRTRNGRRELRT